MLLLLLFLLLFLLLWWWLLCFVVLCYCSCLLFVVVVVVVVVVVMTVTYSFFEHHHHQQQQQQQQAAAAEGKCERVQWLLRAKADPNRAANDLSTTPLHAAVHSACDEVVATLLAANASPSVRLPTGASPLCVHL